MTKKVATALALFNTRKDRLWTHADVRELLTHFILNLLRQRHRVNANSVEFVRTEITHWIFNQLLNEGLLPQRDTMWHASPVWFQKTVEKIVALLLNRRSRLSRVIEEEVIQRYDDAQFARLLRTDRMQKIAAANRFTWAGKNV